MGKRLLTSAPVASLQELSSVQCGRIGVQHGPAGKSAKNQDTTKWGEILAAPYA